MAKNLLEKSGTWISYKGERLGQGRENSRLFLREHTDIRDKIEHELRNLLGLVAEEPKKAAAESEKPAVKAAAAGQSRGAR